MLSCVCLFCCDRMHFARKNCETIKQLPCFTCTCRKKHKLLSRCAICMCCEITVELTAFFFRQNLKEHFALSVKKLTDGTSWARDIIALTSCLIIPAIENVTNWIKIAGKIVDRREGVIYSQKKVGGDISLPSRWEPFVPKQLGITFAALISRKMHLTQSGSKLRARKSN